jgi:hypothetical protein
MNWNAVGAIGEIIGALAVFLTLGYLAVQIRQNTKAVRASALDSSVNAVNDVRIAMFESSEVAALYRRGLENPEELDDDERTRFRLLLHTIIWTVWNIYAQTEYGGLSSSTWAAQLPLLDRIMNSRGGIWFWGKYQMEFEEAFRIEVDKVMKLDGSSI